MTTNIDRHLLVSKTANVFSVTGLLRDAEKQFLSSLKEQSTVVATLELCKVYLRLDQPNTALEVYEKAW